MMKVRPCVRHMARHTTPSAPARLHWKASDTEAAPSSAATSHRSSKLRVFLRWKPRVQEQEPEPGPGGPGMYSRPREASQTPMHCQPDSKAAC